jgi:hypothetical protein
LILSIINNSVSAAGSHTYILLWIISGFEASDISVPIEGTDIGRPKPRYERAVSIPILAASVRVPSTINIDEIFGSIPLSMILMSLVPIVLDADT